MRLGISGGRTGARVPWVIAAAAAAAVSLIIGARLHNAFISAARAHANNIATTAVSRAVSNVFSGPQGEFYSDIRTQDRATVFSADTSRLNLINSRIAELIQEEIVGWEDETFGVPLGSASGIAAFSGLGPEIPVRIRPASLVNTDFDEDFEACGINQTRHSVSLAVEIVMTYSGYLFSESENVKVSVPVLDTVIVGDTPEYYGGGEYFAGNEVRNE